MICALHKNSSRPQMSERAICHGFPHIQTECSQTRRIAFYPSRSPSIDLLLKDIP